MTMCRRCQTPVGRDGACWYCDVAGGGRLTQPASAARTHGQRPQRGQLAGRARAGLGLRQPDDGGAVAGATTTLAGGAGARPRIPADVPADSAAVKGRRPDPAGVDSRRAVGHGESTAEAGAVPPRR